MTTGYDYWEDEWYEDDDEAFYDYDPYDEDEPCAAQVSIEEVLDFDGIKGIWRTGIDLMLRAYKFEHKLRRSVDRLREKLSGVDDIPF